MSIIKLSPDDRNWLQNECISPIIVSALKRINHWDEIAASSEKGIHIISSAVIFILNEFASRGVEFDIYGKEINLFDYSKELINHFNLCENAENINRWCAFLAKIQQHCFREMQALQIVKLEYSELTHDMLKAKVISKLNEEYQSSGYGMSEGEMMRRQTDNSEFMKNCKKIQTAQMPL